MENQPVQSCNVASTNQSCVLASNGRRLANYFLDALFIRILALPVWFLIGLVTGMLGIADAAFWQSISNPAGELIIGCLSVFFYYFVCEALWQRTLGKLITGTRVVTIDGTKPAFGAIGLRTLCRFVPFEPLSFFTRRPGGWHDRWSGTFVVRTQAAQVRQPQPQNCPPVDANFALRRMSVPPCEPAPQSASAPAGLQALNTGIPSCEPIAQRASVPEPVRMAVAASTTARPKSGGRGGKMIWLVVVGAIGIVLGALMIRSANMPVQSASASDTLENQMPPVRIPPSVPSPYARPSARPIPVPSPAQRIPAVPPAPTPASAPPARPPTFEVQAVLSFGGKTVVYSDVGELSEGKTISGWKVVRVTEQEIVMKNGDAVHTYPLSKPEAGPN